MSVIILLFFLSNFSNKYNLDFKYSENLLC